MAHKLTTCTFCGVGCGIYLEAVGNQIVEVRVVVPKVMDERSKEILRELARLNPDDPRANLTQ